MSTIGFFASDIAAATGKTRRWIRGRARKESWPYQVARNKKTGRNQARYEFDRLPTDVQAACAGWPGRGEEEKSQNQEGRSALDQYGEEERRTALLRQSVLERWEQTALRAEVFAGHYNNGVIDSGLLLETGPVSDATLRRWRNKYHTDGLAGLCPDYSARRDVGTLSEEDKRLVMGYYLVPSRPPLTVALESIKQIHKREVPYHAARRFVKALPKPLVTLKRDGEKRHNEGFEPYLDRKEFYKKIRSMEWGCSDHKMFDFLVHADGRVFRPYVTAIIDLRSRKLVGWWIDEQPSTATVLIAMERAAQDYGLFENILVDNGRDYKSKALKGTRGRDRQIKFSPESQGIFQELGCRVHYSLPYRGQSKPIERFFGTMAQQFDKNMPTYVGSNTSDRPEDVKRYYGRFNGKKKLEVTLTLEDARRAFESYANYWNANHHHTGSGMDGRSPDEVFQLHWTKKREIEVPRDRARLLFSEKIHNKPVKRNGIRINGLDYYSEELWPWKGRRVTVRRPVSDIGVVWVYDQKGRYLCEASNDKLAGIGVTSIDLKKVQKAREKEAKQLKERYGWVDDYQRFLPSMADHLLNHMYQKSPTRGPEVVEKVVGIDMPESWRQDHRREGFTVLKKRGAGKKKKRDLEMLF